MKQKPRLSALVPGGEILFQRIFTRLNCEGRPPRFKVEFYPYSSLVLTIRRREDVVYVRFSDLLHRAPRTVLEGAAALLLSRVYRRRAPKALVNPYLDYARSARTRDRMNRMRSGRVRLSPVSPQGAHYDLHKLFDELNQKYFQGQLQRPHIGWSSKSWRRQFGCYDPGPNQILLNRRMDRPGIPQCVVEYVLYHEMLHVKHPTRRSGCSMVSHSPEFRAEERLFREYSTARRLLDHLAR
ncbi:MAG TPA: SprT-like domain-containing protein [Candidatus Saccharimonadales bacterium]|nr:SprT-like domain-containing protein [Candidatus Saccharimonadales bacterium]